MTQLSTRSFSIAFLVQCCEIIICYIWKLNSFQVLLKFLEVKIYITLYTYVLAFKALNWVSVKYMSSSFKTSPPGNVSRLAIAGRRSFLIYKISITLYS